MQAIHQLPVNRSNLRLRYGESKGLLAVMSAGFLGKLRTGAVSGLATKYMATKGSNSIGMIGAVNQAETQLEAVVEATGIKNVRVFSRTAEKRNGFADRMGEKLGVDITPVDSASGGNQRRVSAAVDEVAADLGVTMP